MPAEAPCGHPAKQPAVTSTATSTGANRAPMRPLPAMCIQNMCCGGSGECAETRVPPHPGGEQRSGAHRAAHASLQGGSQRMRRLCHVTAAAVAITIIVAAVGARAATAAALLAREAALIEQVTTTRNALSAALLIPPPRQLERATTVAEHIGPLQALVELHSSHARGARLRARCARRRCPLTACHCRHSRSGVAGARTATKNFRRRAATTCPCAARAQCQRGRAHVE